VSSREERKRVAREVRIESERRDAEAAQRRRRLTQLGGIVLGALVVVGILVAISSGGGSSTTSTPSGGQAANPGQAPALFGGIPQSGLTLGAAKAPVTIVEFNDMQCPVCADYSRTVFPVLVRDYVRTGKLRMEMRLQSFIGPDSVSAGKAVAAAGKQNLAWTFADIFYGNQGQENSGYVTPDYLKSIAMATPGLSHPQLVRDAAAPAATIALSAGKAAFDARGLTGTPSFLIGRTGGPMSVLSFSALAPGQFTSKIDALLGK
jgi:protein-disulfide isomerase